MVIAALPPSLFAVALPNSPHYVGFNIGRQGSAVLRPLHAAQPFQRLGNLPRPLRARSSDMMPSMAKNVIHISEADKCIQTGRAAVESISRPKATAGINSPTRRIRAILLVLPRPTCY